MKDYLSFGLLTLYLFWWRFALVNVGRASLPYLVRYRHCWKQLRCKLNIHILYEEYTILCFEFYLCGLRHCDLPDDYNFFWNRILWSPCLHLVTYSTWESHLINTFTLSGRIPYINLWYPHQQKDTISLLIFWIQT